MKLAIDASNILVGGGLEHLSNVLRFGDPHKHGFSEVHVFGSQATLDQFDKKAWLKLHRQPLCEGGLIARLWWQIFLFPTLLSRYGVDGIFCPGGLLLRANLPVVNMFQNMQVFEIVERDREFPYAPWWRLLILNLLQKYTFRKSAGTIFLSTYSRDYLLENHRHLFLHQDVDIIPHGVTSKPVSRDVALSENDSIRVLYVSTVKMYKHQWNVIEAAERLAADGHPIELVIVGSGDKRAVKIMYNAVKRCTTLNVTYLGHLPRQQVELELEQSDMFVFASSCETFGISLLEAMRHGVPIACSDRGPMPELLRDGGVYFDPEDVDGIADAIGMLLEDAELRSRVSANALKRSQDYSWSKCADHTFQVISKTISN